MSLYRGSHFPEDGFLQVSTAFLYKHLLSSLVGVFSLWLVGYFMEIVLLQRFFFLLLVLFLSSLIGLYESVPKVTVNFSKRGFVIGYTSGLILSIAVFSLGFFSIQN